MEPITFENYREYPAINYSKLKSLDDHPTKIHEEKDWSDGLEFGDALDLLVFTPEEFDKKYYVANLDSLPSDRVQGIIRDVVEHHGEEVTDETVLAAADRDDYLSNWGNSKRLAKILEEQGGAQYARILVNSLDKRILSIQRHMEIVQAVETLKKHEWTKSWLFSDLPERCQRYTQLPLLSFGKPLYKGLLDLLLVNHNTKTIHPWDLKNTGFATNKFRGQFISYSYYIQAALYTYILKLLVAEAEEGTNVQDFTGLDFNPAGYTVENFGFIIISSQDTQNPMRYRCSDNDLYVGMAGGKLSNGRKVKGFIELAEQLIWHQKHDLWSYPYEVYNNDGEVEIDVFSSPSQTMSKEMGGIF